MKSTDIYLPSHMVIAPNTLEGISKAPLSQTVGHILTFLMVFSSDPLREIIKQAGQQNLYSFYL